MTLDFQIDNQIITRKDKHRVVADSQNYLYASFLFSEDWNGTAKTAVFRNEDNEAYNVLLDETDTCLVPAEVLKEGEVSVSVFGGDLITANKAYVYVEESGLENGTTPQPPTPDIYSQILEVAREAEQTAQSVEDRADSGEFKGEKGDKGDKGDDYTLTEQDKEDIADLAAAEIDISGKLDKFQGTENVGKAMVVKPDGKLAPEFVSGSSVRTVFTPTSPTHNIYDFNADTVYDIAAAFQLILPDSEGTQKRRIDVKAGSILYLATKSNGNYYAGSVYPYYQTNLVADIAFFAMDKAVSTTNVNLTTFASIVIALANKQDALAAGAGVTINGNVISADVGLHFQVLQSLPQTGDSLYIYLIPNSGTGSNIYDEYIWVNNKWEKIGTTEIDLSQYVTQAEFNETVENVYESFMPVRYLVVNSLPVSDISTSTVYLIASGSSYTAYRYNGEEWLNEGTTDFGGGSSYIAGDNITIQNDTISAYTKVVIW